MVRSRNGCAPRCWRSPNEHPDSLLRTCTAGHFTGSALVVHDDRERLLLMLHTKAGLWLQPGGHADGQADLSEVALREATEETGIDRLRVVRPAIDLDIHRVPSEGGRRRTRTSMSATSSWRHRAVSQPAITSPRTSDG